MRADAGGNVAEILGRAGVCPDGSWWPIGRRRLRCQQPRWGDRAERPSCLCHPIQTRSSICRCLPAGDLLLRGVELCCKLALGHAGRASGAYEKVAYVQNVVHESQITSYVLSITT